MVNSEVLNSFGALIVPLFIISGKIYIEREMIKRRYSILGIILTFIGFLFFLNGIETTKDKQKFVLWLWLFLMLSHFSLFLMFLEKKTRLLLYFTGIYVSLWTLMVWFLSKDKFDKETQYIVFSTALIIFSNVYYIPFSSKRADMFSFSIPLYAVGWSLLCMTTIYN